MVSANKINVLHDNEEILPGAPPLYIADGYVSYADFTLLRSKNEAVNCDRSFT
jgi:hypothetical protein